MSNTYFLSPSSSLIPYCSLHICVYIDSRPNDFSLDEAISDVVVAPFLPNDSVIHQCANRVPVACRLNGLISFRQPSPSSLHVVFDRTLLRPTAFFHILPPHAIR